MKKKDQKAQLTGTQRSTLTKRQLEHQYKLSLMRDCQIYGKSLEESKLYFNSKGYSLSKSQSTELKKELNSSKMAENWFSKEALYIIEEDHMISVERVRANEDRIVNIMDKLTRMDDFDTKVHFDTNGKGVKPRIENHNTELFLKCNAEWRAIQETKTKMFSATPMVQAMMEVHRRYEDETNKTTESKETEERT